eukprot:TRINITY_DN29271_c0_g1_i1.p1 TRINITY_DN29271_c0_g1~~TRINITY_DN29271_c0_g1_i1.p1  ORF type:complete len:286 (-),score=48.32 TRINITY_DN29271_c0_g1_i1:55-891(-)
MAARAAPAPLAVVTGANKGIGFEIARGCLAAGFRVVITARDASRGQRAELLGCDALLLDLNSEASIRSCAEEVARRYGNIDVLINNASMAYKHADQTPWVQKTKTTVLTNFFGTLAVCQAFVPLVREGGRVVTTASMSGHLSLVPAEGLRRDFASADSSLTIERLSQLMASFVRDVEESRSTASAPSPDWPHVQKGWPNSAYGMSKLAQVALTKIYARTLAPRGIAVNCFCPGSVCTDMNPREQLSPAQGADTAVWLACLPSSAHTGQFFKCRQAVKW